MTAAARRALLALVVVALLAPPTTAHGPPPERDQDRRVLADHNDDCGGDDAGQLSNCQGTHDLVGLDLREARDPTLGDVVVFRLLLNGGSASGDAPLKDTVTLKAGGASKTFALRTTDNQAFTGEGFDRVGPRTATGDGSRFVVEGTVKRDALGAIGALLTDVTVTATRGSTTGDVMPGTYRTITGSMAPTGSQEQNEPTSLRRDYTLRGPGYYVALPAPGATEVPAGASRTVTLQLSNPLRNTAQTFTLTAGSADGAEAAFADGDAATEVDLAGGASRSIELRIEASAPGRSGTLPLTVTTDLGGHATVAIPFTTTAGAATDTDATPPTPARDSPAPALPLALGLLAVAAARRRA